jgi:DNA modification methylase
VSVEIVQGDCREVLRRFPDEHFQTCVTSPPYWGLRDYGLGADSLGLEPTPELYVAHMVEVFREVRRVLRKDGTVWLNLGDSYAGSGRGMTGDGLAGRAGVKQLTNVGSNIDFHDKRVEAGAIGRYWVAPPPGLKPKDLVGIPWRVAFALQADGWWLRSDIVWSKPNPMPESVRDRPTRSHEYVFLLSKSERYYYDNEAIREPVASGPSDIRKMLESKERIGGRYKDADDPLMAASAHTNIGRKRAVGGVYRSGNKERKLEVPTRPNDHRGSSVPWEDNGLGRNRRSVWHIATQPYPGAHFATFPTKLVEPCILAGSREGDTVLDPFAGSGTVGVVAQRLGRHAVLIDASPGYCEMARKRLSQLPLDGVRGPSGAGEGTSPILMASGESVLPGAAGCTSERKEGELPLSVFRANREQATVGLEGGRVRPSRGALRVHSGARADNPVFSASRESKQEEAPAG